MLFLLKICLADLGKMAVASHRRDGFTLIETLIAITILIMAVIGPMTLFSKAIADGLFARDQIIAFYLAHEGLELVINHRSTNVRQYQPWLSGIPQICRTDPGCAVRMDNQGNISFGPGCQQDLCQLYKDDNGRYDYEKVGEKTIFNRFIKIEVDDDDKEAQVISTVEWRNRETILTGHIFNLGI